MRGRGTTFAYRLKASNFYEHLPILVEIVREGRWRTNALKPETWIRLEFSSRLRKAHKDDDYDRTGKRRPGGPRFDKRNGALISWEARPYAEFEISNEEGETLSADEDIDGRLARAEARRGDGGHQLLLADRDSLRTLRGRTWAEYRENELCEERLDKLKGDTAAFDKLVAETIRRQILLTTALNLDSDESEVMAIVELLWSVGPRVYLNFVDQLNRKRLRNAWDRLDRKREKPAFKQKSREYGKKTRREWRYQLGDLPDRRERSYRDDQGAPKKKGEPGGCDRCGALDRRLCTCEVGGKRKRQPSPQELRELIEQRGTTLPPMPS
jgi:hypothetical protein